MSFINDIAFDERLDVLEVEGTLTVGGDILLQGDFPKMDQKLATATNAPGAKGLGVLHHLFAHLSPFFSLSKIPLKFHPFRHILSRENRFCQNAKTHQARNLTETSRKFPQISLRTRYPDTPDHPRVHFALP